MKITTTKLDGVLLIELEAFQDHRGYYVETYNEELYQKNGIGVKFLQDDISVSKKNVLRGIHGDSKTDKLISCLWGEFFFVVIDGRPNSPHFGKWESFTLSAQNRRQVFVPAGYGNGHCVTSDWAIFHYKQSTYYDPDGQFTYKWNDPRFNIAWPVKDPVVSKRDT